jgi:multidrug efflux pump
MKYLPLTLIATLTASLAMALIFVPVLGSVFGKPRLLSAKEKNNAPLAENGNLLKLTGFTGFYVKTLNKAIKSPWVVLFLTTAVAISGVFLFAKSNLGVEFFPDVEPSGINIKCVPMAIFQSMSKIRSCPLLSKKYYHCKMKLIRFILKRVIPRGN